MICYIFSLIISFKYNCAHSLLQLSPIDETIVKEWESEIADAKEFVRKLNIVMTNKDQEEKEIEVEVSPEKYTANQKFGLCEALIKIGDWSTAQKLLKKLPEHSVMVHEPLAKALCYLIHIVIEPVYRQKCAIPNNIRSAIFQDIDNKRSPTPAESFIDLKRDVVGMFVALGPSLHYDPVLLQKLLRIMKAILNDMNVDPLSPPTASSCTEDELSLYHDIITMLDSCVLPALTYMDSNCCVAEEIWSVVKFYPYQYRYCLYGRWKNDSYMMHPKLIRRRGIAQKQIKALMKRVSKENVKPVGRHIGKLSHCSPGFLFDYVSVGARVIYSLITH